MRRQTLVIPIALLLAVMAAAGVVLYTMNVKQDATTGGPTSTVVVAAQDVPAGTQLDALIEEGKLIEQQIPRNYIVPGAVGTLEELQGKTAGQPLLEGEQILENRIAELGAVPGGGLGIPEGFTAFTVELRPDQGVANQLHRGDHVRVFSTFSDRSGSKATVAILSDVMVLDVISLGEETKAANSLLTLAIAPDDAPKLAYAQDSSVIWLNLLPPDARGQAPPAFTDKDMSALVKTA
jgi:pilus assembly protein CpaB